MPKLKFTRTPSEAEGGPNNKYEEGKIYDVGAKSFNRWLDIGCAVGIEDDDEVVKLEEKEEVKEVKSTAVEVEVNKAYKSIESGGQAPPVIVSKKNFIRSAGRGLWNVYDEDGKKLNTNPMTHKDAEEFVEDK